MAAWRGGYVADGRIDGMAYSFAAAYDASENKTVFSLVVAEGTGIIGESVWKGPGTHWSDAGNWTDALPGVYSAAVFSSETAPSTVDVSGEQTVGELEFSAARGYSIEGSGTIRLSDSGSPRIYATAGSSTITTGVMLPSLTDFDISSPAELTMAGPIQRGGLQKRGTGRLLLESSGNEFNMGVRVSEGMLSLATLSAAGMDSSAFRQVTLDGGMTFADA
jgi:hypothetical protein